MGHTRLSQWWLLSHQTVCHARRPGNVSPLKTGVLGLQALPSRLLQAEENAACETWPEVARRSQQPFEASLSPRRQGAWEFCSIIDRCLLC